MSLYARIVESELRVPMDFLKAQFDRERGKPSRGRIKPKAAKAASPGPMPPVWHWLSPSERKDYLRKQRIREGVVTLYDRVFCESAFIPRG